MFFREGKILEINHSAPGIKMNGFDRPGMPYKLGRFVQSGWGRRRSWISCRIRKSGSRCQDAPECKAGAGHEREAGSLRRLGQGQSWLLCGGLRHTRRNGDAEPFVRRQAEYGNHLVWTYGDHAEPMRQLGALMGLQVEIVS